MNKFQNLTDIDLVTYATVNTPEPLREATDELCDRYLRYADMVHAIAAKFDMTVDELDDYIQMAGQPKPNVCVVLVRRK